MKWEAWDPGVFSAGGERMVLVLTGAAWDAYSTGLEETFLDEGVAEIAAEFRALRVDADLRPDLALRLAPVGVPSLSVLSPEGHPLVSSGYAPQRTIREFLSSAALQWRIRAPQLLEEAHKAQVTAVTMSRLRPAKGETGEKFIESVVEALEELAESATESWLAHPASVRLLALRGKAESVQRTVMAGKKETEVANPARMAEYLRGVQGESAARAMVDPWVGPDGMVPRAVTESMKFPGTAESSFIAAAALGRPPAFASRLRDSATGLYRRFAGAPAPFHLADQAAALSALPAREAESLAAVLSTTFWDPDAEAFRDRFAASNEPPPLDIPQFPVEENARAAEALAAIPAHRERARRIVASFSDACRGQGHGGARLALAALRLQRD